MVSVTVDVPSGPSIIVWIVDTFLITDPCVVYAICNVSASEVVQCSAFELTCCALVCDVCSTAKYDEMALPIPMSPVAIGSVVSFTKVSLPVLSVWPPRAIPSNSSGSTVSVFVKGVSGPPFRAEVTTGLSLLRVSFPEPSVVSAASVLSAAWAALDEYPCPIAEEA